MSWPNGPTCPRAALAEVRAQVIEEREQRRAVMLDRLKTSTATKLARRLQAVREALVKPTPGHAWRAALAAAHRPSRPPSRDGDRRGRTDLRAEGLHEVRIAAKKLRYALEIADESGAAPCADSLRLIKRVQDALGRLHDLQILQHHVAAVGAAPRARRSTPDAGLAVLTRKIEDECRHLHGRYVAQLPSCARRSRRRGATSRCG